MLSFVTVEICHLYISPAHNFFGHHGREADDYPTIEVLTFYPGASPDVMASSVTAQWLHTDLHTDWGTSYVQCAALGDKAGFRRGWCWFRFLRRRRCCGP